MGASVSDFPQSVVLPTSWSLSVVLNTVAVVSLTYLLYKAVSFGLRYRKLCQLFADCPGDSSFHWLYGELHKLPNGGEERLKFALARGARFPRYCRFWFGPFNATLILNHPDTIRQLLKTSEGKPRGFGGAYEHGIPWLGEGLLIADGQRWARSRRLLTPAFHFDILKPYISVYNQASDILLTKIDDFAKSGETFELFNLISLCTFDIILRCAFSYDSHCQTKGDTHPYVQAVKELSEDWNYRSRTPPLYPDFIFRLTSTGRRFYRQCEYVHSVAEDIISKRGQTLEKDGVSTHKYLDFLDILLTAKDESGVGMTPLEIRNEVDTFLFEGHDTTASAISWIVYSLAEHTQYQRKVQAEIDDILKEKDSVQIEWDDLPRLEYLTMCIKEGMRLHSPVPFIQRQVKAPITIDGKTFPPGTIASTSLFGLHHNATVWDDPMTYDPERFSKENITKIDTFAFCPFSAGPRNCIGQHFAMNEEKVVIARILQRYNLELDPNHKVVKRPAAVMRAETGIRMTARRRHDI